jgi:hypothetical protein
VEFVAYIDDMVDVMERHGAVYNCSSTRTILSCMIAVHHVTSSVLSHLTNCTADVAQWCASRCLPLNGDKTEIIWLSSHTNQAKLEDCNYSLCFKTEIIIPATFARDLWVWYDAELTMN